ncbi:uncharacterized protein LOC107274883 [Cephus cinctus]|uniref:Uncharacterized protein LOC107274883 n=1 Tax=Cephus cinctus TaxID=211228 RepID=A0AAJ7CG11_CEPCN|nr:uncharacterized protein LOC107274883 [Cephus cinctus]
MKFGLDLISVSTILALSLIVAGQEDSYNVDHDVFKNGNESEVLEREKRTLVYPDPTNLLLIFGLGTPLQLDAASVIVGAFTKLLYALPANATYYTEPGVYYARNTKSRWSIYKVLETAAEVYGFGGKSCILRAICEAAAVPFDHDHGLFGQLFQAFLTPSSTNEEHDEYQDRDYHAAERLGKHVGENCHVLYPECEKSILDVFSTTSA